MVKNQQTVTASITLTQPLRNAFTHLLRQPNFVIILGLSHHSAHRFAQNSKLPGKVAAGIAQGQMEFETNPLHQGKSPFL
jgi:hypothetical protein